MTHVRYQIAFKSGMTPEILGHTQYTSEAEAEEDAALFRAKHAALASADVVRVVEMREARRRS